MVSPKGELRSEPFRYAKCTPTPSNGVVSVDLRCRCRRILPSGSVVDILTIGLDPRVSAGISPLPSGLSVYLKLPIFATALMLALIWRRHTPCWDWPGA